MHHKCGSSASKPVVKLGSLCALTNSAMGWTTTGLTDDGLEVPRLMRSVMERTTIVLAHRRGAVSTLPM